MWPFVGLLFLLAASARADDVLQPGSVVLDRSTVVTLGIRLLVAGDDDHDASVQVRYRPTGDVVWRTAQPLFRVRPESVTGRVVPEQFAGSIFDLAPATTYDIELRALDADGPVDEIVLTSAATRAVPGDPAAPTVRPVATASALRSALLAAQPGDVITLADGTYAGPFEIDASGTAANPIVIRGGSTVGVTLDGGGCDCNLLEIRGSFVHLERMTLRKARTAIRFKPAATEGNVVRRVRIDDVRNGMLGDPDQRDFYVCDNVLHGHLRWPQTYGDDGGSHANDDGINVMGDGHVVCHNVLGGFGDALKVEQDGSRADDFYGNEVLSAYDNAVELDGSEGNTRAFRNRFTNSFVPLSFQPIFGGPSYAFRNVVVNVAEDHLKLYARGTDAPSGVVVLHNTFVSSRHALEMGSPATSHHVRIENNLFVAPATAGPTVALWLGAIDDVRLDVNGWFPDGTFDFGPTGSWASFAAFEAGSSLATGGRVLNGPPFASGLVPPATYRTEMLPADATLASSSNAVDGATTGLGDSFTGSAPDLGALERGCPIPIYGVRPEGIDETNAPTGCGGPSNTTLPAVPIDATKLSLRGDSIPPVNASARKLTFKSTTTRSLSSNRILLPAAGGVGDPTLHGGTLQVYNAAGGSESLTIPIPAAGWTASGSGYRFKGSAGGIALTITIRRDKLSIAGKGAGLAYSLAAPPQGRIAVRLGLGSAPPWCAEVPAKASGVPPSTAKFDRVDRFDGRPLTPAPLVCPDVP
ncbi:MAG TPA: hypothetical protein VGR62_24665 [Candidatus Binatia bacterium]|nr:hypothetical protein [Candidatus Binatia bacterium]